jgi:subtilisin family serine protease
MSHEEPPARIRENEAARTVGSVLADNADDPGAPRFPSGVGASLAENVVAGPAMVEVEFRADVRPALRADGAENAQPASVTVDLSGFGEVLQRYGVVRMEPSFAAMAMPADEALAPQTAFENVETLPDPANFITLHVPAGGSADELARELRALPAVARAVPVPEAIPPQGPLVEAMVGTNDQLSTDPATGLDRQWYVFRCRANQAWSAASGAGVVLADIDFGFRTSHRDLAPNFDLTNAFNAVDGSQNVSQGNQISHGTGVLGLAGAAVDQGGMAGIAFGATLWPIQANTGAGTPLPGNAWARAIEWVRTRASGGRRKVIILEVQTGTYGNYEMIPSVNAAIRLAITSGIVVCVAAGNGNRDATRDDQGNPIPPTGSILVGATEFDPTQNRRASFSNFGPTVVVAAPGDSTHDVTCHSSGDNAYTNSFGGTSGATPKVAAAAALMLEANPQLTHAQIRTIFQQTGSMVVTDAGKPVGRFLNVEAAVQKARTLAPAPAEAAT